MRSFTWIPLLAALALLNACSTSRELREERLEQGQKISQGNTEFYRGEVLVKQGKTSQSTPATLQVVTFRDEGRIEVSIHQKRKSDVLPYALNLERIGTTEVFFISDQDRKVQGRVRFSGGEDWKWNEWAIGLQDDRRTAIAGAMVRDPSTGSYRLRLEATSEKGKLLETVTGVFTFVTQDAYAATLQSWGHAKSHPSE